MGELWSFDRADPIRWRKASHSQGGSGNCVEVARDRVADVLVRDSKNPGGGVLVLSPDAWRGLMAEIKDGMPVGG